MRRFASIAAILILTSCSGHDAPPSTVADACRMQQERPHWFSAMKDTQARWGVPVSVQLATISRESSFQYDAQPMKKVGSGIFSRRVPRSSAYGYSQALDGTWEWYMRDTGRSGADREDFADSSDFIGWYMNLNSRLNGVPLNDAYNQYLAYHEGKTGYAKGTWRRKAWLPAVARDVQSWAERYEQQLRLCPAR
ncbi:lytic transglycosylase [Amaricoccus solimangrovi]|uniref:Lytic transglycosylase n=1 Tax=Amaricoccus solimangrovi TaxID=2589815 RepID=A0A501WTM5_9RHOB|nr:lytic transglycosylase [Amaricoccus solimangrovi]TPE52719.1 lytic transglycosylase [Amaricoccus solimangrovi]